MLSSPFQQILWVLDKNNHSHFKHQLASQMFLIINRNHFSPTVETFPNIFFPATAIILSPTKLIITSTQSIQQSLTKLFATSFNRPWICPKSILTKLLKNINSGHRQKIIKKARKHSIINTSTKSTASFPSTQTLQRYLLHSFAIELFTFNISLCLFTAKKLYAQYLFCTHLNKMFWYMA